MGTTPRADGYSGRRVRAYVAAVLARWGSTCHLCGKPGADSADHVIPRSAGGSVWDVANGRPAHHLCNLRRGAMPLAEWFARNPLPTSAVSTPRPPSRKW